MDKPQKSWVVYILECGDGTFYTGVTDDLQRRFKVHCSGTGAKYTRGRGPLKIVYSESASDRREALRREYAIKQLSRAEKQKMIRKGE